jgi:hypothetical protein
MLDATGLTVERLGTRNELSWPISRYARVYLLEKQGLPTWPAPCSLPCCGRCSRPGSTATRDQGQQQQGRRGGKETLAGNGRRSDCLIGSRAAVMIAP